MKDIGIMAIILMLLIIDIVMALTEDKLPVGYTNTGISNDENVKVPPRDNSVDFSPYEELNFLYNRNGMLDNSDQPSSTNNILSVGLDGANSKETVQNNIGQGLVFNENMSPQAYTRLRITHDINGERLEPMNMMDTMKMMVDKNRSPSSAHRSSMSRSINKLG